jgi:hypothetical protein
MRFFCFFIFLSFFAKAQIDSALTIPLVGIHVSGEVPFADLANRFGPNLGAGAAFMLKTKKNWVYGVETNYMFSRNVKEDVLKQLKNAEGNVTNNLGYPADIRVTERGLGLHLFVGKIFKVLNQNPNSGLMINVGVGYLQHKVNIYDAEQKIAAVKGNLRYGFDRLSAGVSFSQFVGYLFLSENKLLNFYFGIESYEAFTKSLRKINYDTGLPDTKQRLDILGGLRFGWIVPLYKKKPNEFYYN